MTLGHRIKKRREELGFTQDELAKKLGYKSRSSINKIELGLNDISQSKIEAFAKALHTTPSHLMGWEKQFSPLPTENIIQITRRTGIQERYILSDEQVVLVEGLVRQISLTSPYGEIAAEGEETKSSFSGSLVAHGGESNKTGKKRVKPTIHD